MFADKDSFKKAFVEKLEATHGKRIGEAALSDVYKTLGIMIREYISRNWINTNERYATQSVKQVYYFSMEFLLGRLMGVNLLNLGLKKICEEGLIELGINLDDVEKQEHDAGLGNGGLGRLAACFLDSLASLKLPGHGCGIRYKYGLFEQKIMDGYQVELPEDWLREGNVWEIRRPDQSVEVRFGGFIKQKQDGDKLFFEHQDYETVLAVPYDMPVIGYKNNTINTLQLWSAESMSSTFDFKIQKGGHKFKEYKDSAESISELLYPDDTHYEGRMLRLKQEYFLVSASLQNIVSKHKKRYSNIHNFADKVAVHLNDTHPVLAIPELMRILMDEENLDWEEAWEITTKVMSYTNHTTLSEALEKWPVDMISTLLPRIYMIVDEINERFCRTLWGIYPGEWDKIASLAVKSYGQIRMAPLAIVGTHSTNGVSQIHTEILKTREMKEYFSLFPDKFNNKTNGVSHRIWLLKANPSLAKLISRTIGEQWVTNPIELSKLLKYAQDSAFQQEFRKVKLQNKSVLARTIKESNGINIDTSSIFDVQVKRLHLYKRQLLNVIHILYLYNQLCSNPELDIAPRTFIFGAKSAPGYHLSKKIIKLINTIATKVNNDKRINGKLKVVFLENYRVTLAEKIIPAADVSEQISTASKEASGTGNMKFMMNGALTLGTLDGANIEIKEAVGANNIFTFGLTADEVTNYYNNGGYNAWEIYYSDPRVKKIIEQIHHGFFPIGEHEFDVICHSLLSYNDEFFVLKDFSSYVEAQQQLEVFYRDSAKWSEMCIINIANSGRFSSDYTINKYAEDIWGIYTPSKT